MKRYPVRVHEDREEDAESIQQHTSAMVAEMSKKKPREHVILPLLKSTFSARRDYVTSTDRTDVREILEEYPALHLPSAVSKVQFCCSFHILCISVYDLIFLFCFLQIEQDMSIMFDGENVKESFQANWNGYVTAILTYTEEQTWPWRLSLDPSGTYI